MKEITGEVDMKGMMTVRWVSGWLAGVVLLAACAAPQPTRVAENVTASEPPEPTATATHTPTHTPTWTPPPTHTPIPTLTPTPTPAPNPLSVEFMRKRSYPGSDIVIEQTLAPGANYNQYVVSYKSDGLKIYALMTVPLGPKPATGWPVVVFNHGYIPPAQYRTTERYVAYVAAFARSGYIVFKSDYRGHGDSEGRASGGYGTPDYTIDVLNAVGSIKRYRDADPNRIGVWGHSMGGSATLRAMVVSKDIKAGVIWAGVVASYPDLISRWRRPATGSAPTPAATAAFSRRWRDDLIAQYGAPDQNPNFWASISPNSYLRDLSGPIQLHHGTADAEVPLEFSETLYKQIQDVKGLAEVYIYQGDEHNITASFNIAMPRSIQFMDKYVKGQ